MCGDAGVFLSLEHGRACRWHRELQRQHGLDLDLDLGLDLDLDLDFDFDLDFDLDFHLNFHFISTSRTPFFSEWLATEM